MDKLFIVLLLALLTGCIDNVSLGDSETKQRKLEVFERCMKLIPNVPGSANYDDFDDVIRQCRITADMYAH